MEYLSAAHATDRLTRPKSPHSLWLRSFISLINYSAYFGIKQSGNLRFSGFCRGCRGMLHSNLPLQPRQIPKSRIYASGVWLSGHRLFNLQPPRPWIGTWEAALKVARTFLTRCSSGFQCPRRCSARVSIRGFHHGAAYQLVSQTMIRPLLRQKPYPAFYCAHLLRCP